MKIAFLYMDVSNLGDLVIRDTSRHILDSILEENDLDDAEVVPMDIGELRYKQSTPAAWEMPPMALAKAVKFVALRRKVFKPFPNLSQGMLLWGWHHSRFGKFFRVNEMPKLEGVDTIVFGGGGLIKYHQQSFHYVLNDVTEYALRHDIPVLINSVGVEGYSKLHPGCKILKRAINRDCVKYISSRDDYESLVRDYVENEQIDARETADPAFWTAETYEVAKDPHPRRVVGLNVIRFAIFSKYLYKVKRNTLDSMYYDLINLLLEEGYDVDLFSNGVAGDTKYIDHLMTKYPEMAQVSRITVSTPKTPRELVELIASYERFVAVRLHSSIVGSVLGVPNVSLVWNVKQPLFGKRIGLPQNYLLKADFDGQTVFDRLMAAEPYVMDEEYKQSVYDGLEESLLKWVDQPHEPISAVAWRTAKMGQAVSGAALDVACATGLWYRILRKNVRRVRKTATKAARVGLFELRSAYFRSTVKTDPNKIAIMTNTFRYTCNPKYIYEEFLRRGLDFDITWLVQRDEERESYPEGTKVVRYNTPEGLREVFSAKLWLDNGIAFSNKFDKKKDQVHVQTMHGSLGIKSIDNAVLARNARGKRGQRVVRRESENTNFVITNSKFEEGVFRRVFWKDTPMVRLGHARTDVLLSEDEQFIGGIRKDLETRYGIPQDAKIAMFAPTHRAGLTAKDLYIDYPLFKETLERKFGGEFVVLVRLHDRTKNLNLEGIDQPFVYDVTDYPDMQELMMVTDVGITDYSSWIFDYVITKRPGFHYVADLDRYVQRTGFAYPIEESAFPFARTFEELIDLIDNFDEETYRRRVEDFLEEKQSVDDGHSAERIVDWMTEDVLS